MSPDFILVDVREVIIKYNDNPNVRALQPFIPLHTLISCALAFNQYTPDTDSFWHYFENRCANILDMIDFNVMEIFMDTLTMDLDECIRRKVPIKVDSGDYVLKEWVDGSIIILSYDDSANFYKAELDRPQLHQPIYQPTSEQLSYFVRI